MPEKAGDSRLITADISLSPSKERYEGFVEGLEEKGVCDIMEYHGYGVEIFDAWGNGCCLDESRDNPVTG